MKPVTEAEKIAAFNKWKADQPKSLTECEPIRLEPRKMTHIMLDLETWGLTPGSDIRSIGAVVFDPIAGVVPKPPQNFATPFIADPGYFYAATDNPIGIWRNGGFWQDEDNQLGDKRRKYLDLTRNPETVKWWSEQSEEAQKAFANPIDLREALWYFGRWTVDIMGSDGAHMEQPTMRIWVNGPHFDIAILAAAYRAVRLPEPWHYREPRDMRTIADAAGMTKDEFCNYGEPHNALHDAIAQAMTVCDAYKRLGLQR